MFKKKKKVVKKDTTNAIIKKVIEEERLKCPRCSCTYVAEKDRIIPGGEGMTKIIYECHVCSFVWKIERAKGSKPAKNITEEGQ